MMFLRALRLMAFLAGIASLFWMTGLLLFVDEVRHLDAGVTDPDPQPVDAVVVLTGGSERFSKGLELLGKGFGKKLFVSGVHPNATLEHVMGNQKIADELRHCCIVLGHEAESTEGNAEETKSWLQQENYHSIRLVTANYHMPRSLLVFQKLLPDVTILAHPVAPDSVLLNEWWRHAGTASLLVTEYDKYLAAQLGLWIASP